MTPDKPCPPSQHTEASAPSVLASVADLPECCAGEGYPGIAHDLETMRAERDSLLARCASLEAALRGLLDDANGAELGPGIARLYVTIANVDAARAALKGAQP